MNKYLPKSSRKDPNDPRGRRPDPSTWITGPCEFTREKYYAYLKHKAQANFRKEEHALTWDDWQALWSDDLFRERGRGLHDMILSRVDFGEGWTCSNSIVCSRREHFDRLKAYRRGIAYD